MRRAILFTAFARLDYLERTLKSWSFVRGLGDWDLYFSIEPSPNMTMVRTLIREFCESLPEHGDVRIHMNETRLGVLLHPFVGLETLFTEGYDFVVRAEDDLIVSDDILEFFNYASEAFRDNTKVLTVCSASNEAGDPAEVRLAPGFSPWLWGTWQNRWLGVLRGSWDWNYSTFNGQPGNESGWDWNINTRIMPKLGALSAWPAVSRVDNIGVIGTHGTAENFATMRGFQDHQEPQEFRQV